MEESPKKKLRFVVWTVIIFVFLGFFVSFFASLFISSQPIGNVALISINGEITSEEYSSFSGASTAGSTELVKLIKEAEENPLIEAIVFQINSPGGSPVASQEIADAVKRVEKPKVALIREVGASGGYWIASASDYIIANKMSITGSIGVIGSYIEYSGLLERYNMTYQRLTSGDRKDLGDPFRPLDLDEKDLILDKLGKIHDIFIEAIAENRDMSEQQVRDIATGEFYLGIEALGMGLIDEVGDIETAKQYLGYNYNITEIEFAEYKYKKTLLDALTGVISPQSFMVGKGIGSELSKISASRKVEIIT